MIDSHKNTLMSILIIGYDGYSDLWNDCVLLLKRFWHDCPYDILFVNNSKTVSWDGVTTLHAGEDAEWSKKVQLGLSHIKTDYVCLLLEDFLVFSDISTATTNDLLGIMQHDSIDYIKLADLNNPRKNHSKR